MNDMSILLLPSSVHCDEMAPRRLTPGWRCGQSLVYVVFTSGSVQHHTCVVSLAGVYTLPSI